MKPLYLCFNPENFWKDYWEKVGVDEPQFIDLNMYPIYPTRMYLSSEYLVLECGFGCGRVLRHIQNKHLSKIVGLEYDYNACRNVHVVEPNIPNTLGSVLSLPFVDDIFDVTLCFGVLGTLGYQIHGGMNEIIRVTRKDGIIVVSLIIDNFARKLQAILSKLRLYHKEEVHLYTMLDSFAGWKEYLQEHNLKIIEANYVISRYNLFYWTPFLRSRKPHDEKKARVNEREYKFNWLGELLFIMFSRFFPKDISASAIYVCEKQ